MPGTVLPRMWRKLFPLLLLVPASCSSSGPEADLQYIKQAHSLGAEWALLNEQAAQGRLTQTYVDSMHQWLRDQLRTSADSLTQPNSPYGDEIRALLADADDADAAELRSHSDKLKQIEDHLESA